MEAWAWSLVFQMFPYLESYLGDIYSRMTCLLMSCLATNISPSKVPKLDHTLGAQGPTRYLP